MGASIIFPVRVTSNSMAPYVATGDYGVAVYTHDIRRGDVIVFHFPLGAPTLAIKRAAALPGECIPPHGGVAGSAALGPVLDRNEHCVVVPPGSIYILGDNIAWSIDSRHFGAVPSEEIVGKMVLRVPVTRWLARWRELIGSA